MPPVSMNGKPVFLATSAPTALFPEAAGPSMAIRPRPAWITVRVPLVGSGRRQYTGCLCQPRVRRHKRAGPKGRPADSAFLAKGGGNLAQFGHNCAAEAG